MIDWTLPIKITSPNVSLHWAIKNKRNQINKKIIVTKWKIEKPSIEVPCRVELIRIGLRELDDDNLIASFKNVRDIIADLIIPGLAPGRADGIKTVTWCYGQEKGKINAIRIKITS